MKPMRLFLFFAIGFVLHPVHAFAHHGGVEGEAAAGGALTVLAFALLFTMLAVAVVIVVFPKFGRASSSECSQ